MSICQVLFSYVHSILISKRPNYSFIPPLLFIICTYLQQHKFLNKQCIYAYVSVFRCFYSLKALWFQSIQALSALQENKTEMVRASMVSHWTALNLAFWLWYSLHIRPLSIIYPSIISSIGVPLYPTTATPHGARRLVTTLSGGQQHQLLLTRYQAATTGSPGSLN